MRNVIEPRRPPGSIVIEDIELDAKSRDDTPAILIGLQAIWRNEVFGTHTLHRPTPGLAADPELGLRRTSAACRNAWLTGGLPGAGSSRAIGFRMKTAATGCSVRGR